MREPCYVHRLVLLSHDVAWSLTDDVVSPHLVVGQVQRLSTQNPRFCIKASSNRSNYQQGC